MAHRLAGRRCEDASGGPSPPPGDWALIVADGVSTAGRGGEGADLAVEAASWYLSHCPGWGLFECREAVARASDRLVSAAAGPGPRPVAELATTLVVALVSSEPDGAGAVLARVGDSAAFTLDGGDWQEVFVAQESDDLHQVVTDVLPLPARPAGLRVVETASIELAAGAAIVLVTDGIANPLRDGPVTVAPALAEVLRSGGTGRPSPLALATAADFSRRGCQDDRTILVAWPLPAG